MTVRLLRDDARFGVALLRFAPLPLLYIGYEYLISRDLYESWFVPLLLAASAYALLVIVTHLRGWRPREIVWVEGAADITFLCLLTYASGGVDSPIAKGFFVIPLGAAFLCRPRTTLAWAVATPVLYCLSVAFHHTFGDNIGRVAEHSMFLCWAGAGAVYFSVILSYREDRIGELATIRGQLLARATDADDRAKRRLAEALHDQPIQMLLSARQDLDEATHGNPTAIERAEKAMDRTLEQLRGTIFDLHPGALEGAGLAAALRALTEQHALRGEFRATVSVADDAVGYCDALLLSLAGKLISNVVQHAAAAEAHVALTRDDDAVVLVVRDDGRGMASERPLNALQAGHIGIAVAHERVRALDGALTITSAPGEGTTVTIRIPIEETPAHETVLRRATVGPHPVRERTAPGVHTEPS